MAPGMRSLPTPEWRNSNSSISGGANQVEVPRLRVVHGPVVGGVDAEQRESGPAPLDHVATVLHEHLPRVPAPANHLALPRVAVVVAQHRHHAERWPQLPKRTHV